LSSGKLEDTGPIRAAYIQSRIDHEQEKDMCRPDGTLKSNIFLIPAIKMAGYGIGRPDGTFWMSIAGHLTPLPIRSAIRDGLPAIAGQAQGEGA